MLVYQRGEAGWVLTRGCESTSVNPRASQRRRVGTTGILTTKNRFAGNCPGYFSVEIGIPGGTRWGRSWGSSTWVFVKRGGGMEVEQLLDQDKV